MSPFQHDCTACERTQLIFPSMATGLAETARGTEMTFTCWCGATQSRVLTPAAEQRADVLAAA